MKKRIVIMLFLFLGILAGCSEPTPTPPPASCQVQPFDLPVETRIPPVTEDDHTEGPANAPITIIEYADFQ